MDQSIDTRLRITNYTSSDVRTTRINPVDNYDWDGNSRPDHNMQNRFIPINGSIEEIEKVNVNASHCGWSMNVYLADGREFKFGIHQKFAIGCCAGFSHEGNIGVHINHQRFGDNGIQITFRDDPVWKREQDEEKKRKEDKERRLIENFEKINREKEKGKIIYSIEMSQSISTRLRITNYTSSDVRTTKINPVDNYDWNGCSRPDYNMQNRFIPINGSIEEREEVNANASHCGWSMNVYLADGREFKFGIHQKFAIGCCSGFSHEGNIGVHIKHQRFVDNGIHITFRDDPVWKREKDEEKKRIEEQEILLRENLKKQAEEIRVRDEELKIKDEEKKRKEEEIKRLENELKRKNIYNAGVKENLKKQSEEIRVRDEELRRKEKELSQKEEEIKISEEKKQKLASGIKKTVETLNEKIKKLEKKKEQHVNIEKENKKMIKKEEEIRKKEKELSDAEDELKKNIEEKNKEIKEREKKLDERSKKLVIKTKD